MDIIEIAKKAGMLVLLDAQIGHQKYHSVCGSLPALQRFADAVCASMSAECHGEENRAEQHAEA
jgi:hypothetical protein